MLGVSHRLTVYSRTATGDPSPGSVFRDPRCEKPVEHRDSFCARRSKAGMERGGRVGGGHLRKIDLNPTLARPNTPPLAALS